MKILKLGDVSKRPDNFTGIIESDTGVTYWYLNGEKHREDGPASIHFGGSEFWYKNGKWHREDGPAVEHRSGNKEWYLDGIPYTEEEHKKEMVTRNSSVGKLLRKKTML